MLSHNLFRVFSALTKDDVNKLPQNPLKDTVLKNGLEIFFGIAGAVAVLFITLGAFKYVISRGDPNSIKNAKETIIYAAVGLVITISGYAIVNFVVGRL